MPEHGSSAVPESKALRQRPPLHGPYGFEPLRNPAPPPAAPAWRGLALLRFEQGRLAYRADFVFYALVIAALAVLIVFASEILAPEIRLGLIAAGMLGWTLIEYFVHRVVLHHWPPFRHWHAEHHRRPAALIGMPTLLSSLLFAGLVFAPVWGIFSLWPAAHFTLGVLLGYFVYACNHHAQHQSRRADKLPPSGLDWHAQHHAHAGRHRAFGVSTSLWDHVFGSARQALDPPAGERHRSRARHPSVWL